MSQSNSNQNQHQNQLTREQNQLRLSGEIYFNNAAPLVTQLERELQPGITQLDCSQVHQADSALVALLIEARKLARARGLTLHISGLPIATTKLATLYGVESVL